MLRTTNKSCFQWLLFKALFFGLFTNTSLVSQEATSNFNAFAKIIQRRCIECHRKENSKGSISFQQSKSAQLDEIVDLDDPDSSRLLEVITPDQFGTAEMPKNRTALSRSEIEVVRKWIAAGAKWPDGRQIQPEPNIDLKWWSLSPLKAPPLKRNTGENPVDFFIGRKHSKKKLRFSKPADRRTLIRRLYQDLTGLPPTEQEILDFENDSSEQAYGKLVDRLLASPRYGERWARHWLDVVHYGDTHGFDKDKLRPNAWRYRDWVIRSFNQDKNYSDFVREQIAGDVLRPNDPDAIIATGMVVAGPFDWVGQIEVANGTLEKKRVRNLDRDDMLATVMNVFTSTTVQCARCHDHKFDPIKQTDYYALQSVFAGIDRADRKLPRNVFARILRLKCEFEIQRINDHIRNLKAAHAASIKPEVDKINTELDEVKKRLSRLPGPFAKRDGEHRNSNGFHSKFADKPDVKKWIELELESPQSLSSILIYPARPVDFPDTPGFAFPKRWMLEAFDKSGKSQLIADYTKSDFLNPGDNLVAIKIPTEHRDQKWTRLRLTASKLATRSPT